MKPSLASLPESLFAVLTRLAEHRGTLLLTLLLLDGLFHPYHELHHDSKLYAVQILNRVEGGLYDGDLYLAHGSQDRYSLFSVVMAPLTALLGLAATSFLVYLAAKALFFWGMIRLFEALVPDRRASTLGLLCVAVTLIAYGGLQTFHVNEAFLTPRLLASGLLLVALERVLAGRVVPAGVVLLTALALHPLIAFVGVLVALFCAGARLVSVRVLLMLTALACIGLGAFCLNDGLGMRFLGRMDDEWRDLVFRRSGHCFPSDWTFLDWVRIGSAFGLTLAARRYLTPAASTFCLAVCAAGFLGLVASWFAEETPYALLLQGQPFRALWLLQLLCLPLGFFLVFRFAAEPRPLPQLVALLLLYCVGSNFDASPQVLVTSLYALPVLALCFRGLGRSPRHPRWLSLSAAVSLGVALGLAFVLNLRGTAADWELLVRNYEPLILVWALPASFDRFLVLVAAVLLAGLVLGALGAGRKAQAVLAGLWLGYQGLLVGLGHWEPYLQAMRRDHGNMTFLRSVLDGERNGRPLTVYWATELNHVWFDLRANSYFHLMQTPGNIFNRQTAIDGDRRARLTWKFDLEYLTTLPIPDRDFGLLLRNYTALPEDAPIDRESLRPGRADLRRLCEDPSLDYVITRSDLGPGCRATNGKVYVYDCREVRGGER